MRTFATMLTVLFIGLKLTDYIDWSWPVVLSPILVWLSIVIVLVFLIVLTRVFGWAETEEDRKKRLINNFVNSEPNSPQRDKALFDLLTKNKK